MTVPARVVAELQCRAGMLLSSGLVAGVLAFQSRLCEMRSNRVKLFKGPVNPAGGALNLSGSLSGKTVPDGADSGLPLLACAGVLPGQGLYVGRGNCTARHGKEKVYGSIP
jgi:hypothetical protein